MPRWSVPLVGPSLAERGKGEGEGKEEEKIERRREREKEKSEKEDGGFGFSGFKIRIYSVFSFSKEITFLIVLRRNFNF